MNTSVTRSTEQHVTTTAAEKSPSTVPHVVIIGGGFGGLEAAKDLARQPIKVTLVDRHNFHLFQPMLYQVAASGLSAVDISTPIRHILRKQQHTDVLMAEVTGIDVHEQRVLMQDQSLHYDYLIVATGASSNYFGHPEWQKLAPGLKSLEDALSVRRMVLSAFEAAEKEPDAEKRKGLLTFALVGGGPTGVELAGAIAELAHQSLAGDFRHIQPAKARVVLVQGHSRILPSFPASLARKSQRKLQQLGVEVRTGVHVKEVNQQGVEIGDEHLLPAFLPGSPGFSCISCFS